jgi:hypothetical protein
MGDGIALMPTHCGSCSSAAGVDEDEAMYTFQDKDILECEFYVVEALQFDLILHHPFPSLLQYVEPVFL